MNIHALYSLNTSLTHVAMHLSQFLPFRDTSTVGIMIPNDVSCTFCTQINLLIVPVEVLVVLIEDVVWLYMFIYGLFCVGV